MSAARVSDEQIAEAKRYPLRLLIERERPVQRAGRLYRVCCPLHDERSPSFYIYPDSHGHCFGCGGHVKHSVHYLELTRRMSFVEAVMELTSNGPARKANGEASHRRFLPKLGAATEIRPPLFFPDETRNYVRELWAGADAPRLAEVYLYSRGIALRPKALPWSLRGHYRVWCNETRQERPCVLAAISGSDWAVLAVQRIWVERSVSTIDGKLPPKGARAADLSAGKKTLGSLGRGAVRLSEPTSILGLAEGVESAMSAAQLFSLPVWAVCGNLAREIDLPPSVSEIVLFGDNGDAGRKMALNAFHAYHSRGLTVSCSFPPPECGDWNDFLRER